MVDQASSLSIKLKLSYAKCIKYFDKTEILTNNCKDVINLTEDS